MADRSLLCESDEALEIAINNSFVNLLGYPHGKGRVLHDLSGVAVEELQKVFDKWRGLPEEN